MLANTNRILGAALATSPREAIPLLFDQDITILNKKLTYAQIAESLLLVSQHLSTYLEEITPSLKNYRFPLRRDDPPFLRELKQILAIMSKITNADTALTKKEKLAAMNSALEHLSNTTHEVKDIAGEEITMAIQRAMHGIANDAITLAPNSLGDKHSILTAVAQRDFQPTAGATEAVMGFMSRQKQTLTQLIARSKDDGAIAVYKIALRIVDQILEERDVSQLPAFYDFYNMVIAIHKEQHPDTETTESQPRVVKFTNEVRNSWFAERW